VCLTWLSRQPTPVKGGFSEGCAEDHPRRVGREVPARDGQVDLPAICCRQLEKGLLNSPTPLHLAKHQICCEGAIVLKMNRTSTLSAPIASDLVRNGLTSNLPLDRGAASQRGSKDQKREMDDNPKHTNSSLVIISYIHTILQLGPWWAEEVGRASAAANKMRSGS
jgi:hypothetical protein